MCSGSSSFLYFINECDDGVERTCIIAIDNIKMGEVESILEDSIRIQNYLNNLEIA